MSTGRSRPVRWSLAKAALWGFGLVGGALLLLLALASAALPRGAEGAMFAEVLVAAVIGAGLFAGVAFIRNWRLS